MLSSEEARSIAREDLRYLDAISSCAERNDAAIAKTIPLPRSEKVSGMVDHHLITVKKPALPSGQHQAVQRIRFGWYMR